MDIVINTGDLVDALTKIQGITDRNTNLAITKTVLIRSKGENEVELVASDLNTGFAGVYPAAVSKPGAVAINARKIMEIAKRFPKDGIRLYEAEKRWIEVGGGPLEYHIVGMDPDDFPEPPVNDAGGMVDVNVADLKRAIRRTVIVRGAVDDSRAHIAGAYLDPSAGDGSAQLVTTDGSRLSVATLPWDGGWETPLLIPKTGLLDILKFLPAAAGTVSVAKNDTQFFVSHETPAARLTIRLLEGDFPDYRKIITRESIRTFSVAREPFAGTLGRMSILTTEKYKGAIFSMAPECLTVSVSNPDIGESREELHVKYTGEPVEIAFNQKYFIDAMSVMDADDVVVDLDDVQSPALIRGDGDDGYVAVVMPMKI